MLVNKNIKIYNGENEIVKVYNGTNVVYEKTGPLPPGYTELDYLQSRGNQYIDTGIKASSGITADIDFTLHQTLGGWNALIGGGDGPYNNVFCNGVSYYGSLTGGWITRGPSSNTNNFVGNNIMQTNLRTNIQCLKTSCIYTNTNGTTTFYTPSEYEFTANHTIYLFAQNKSGGIEDKTTLRIHYCKIYDNGTLIRDFVPALDANNLPCMYDKVSKTSFYNVGSDSFLYG